MRLGLDPGHGGYDRGAANGTFVEKDMNLYVCLKVKKLVESKVRVYMTRETDKYVSLVERSHILNNLDTDINISVHHNAANGKAQGFEIYYFTGSKQGSLLANAVGAEFAKSRPKRYIGPGMMVGTKTGNYWMTRATRAPTILTEYGFLDNPVEQKAMDLDKQAHEIATGIFNYFKIPIETDEDIVDKLIAKNVIGSKAYWMNALKTGVVKPEYLRIAFKNFLSL